MSPKPVHAETDNAMFKLIIPVLMMVAAWSAWRRDPAFSTRETIRRGLFLLVAVAALVAVNTVAVSLSIHRGPFIAGWTIGTVTLLSTAGFIWAIMAFTAPRHDPLPTGTPILQDHRKALAGQARWFLIIALLVTAATGISALLHWDSVTLVGMMIGCMVVGLWGILLFAQFIKATQLDIARTAERLNPPRT